MIRDRASRRLPVILTFIVGLTLTIMPLPGGIDAFRPDWLAMLVIFWAMQLPRTWSVGTAWIIGIVLDVSQGTLLGQHALALCCVAFITVRFHLLMRVFPITQLTATVFPILATYQFLLFWVNGVRQCPFDSVLGSGHIRYVALAHCHGDPDRHALSDAGRGLR